MVGPVPGFELAGYERSFLDAFSGRRRAILEHLERLGLPYTPELAQMAALHTRRRKQDRGLAGAGAGVAREGAGAGGSAGRRRRSPHAVPSTR